MSWFGFGIGVLIGLIGFVLYMLLIEVIPELSFFRKRRIKNIYKEKYPNNWVDKLRKNYDGIGFLIHNHHFH